MSNVPAPPLRFEITYSRPLTRMWSPFARPAAFATVIVKTGGAPACATFVTVVVRDAPPTFASCRRLSVSPATGVVRTVSALPQSPRERASNCSVCSLLGTGEALRAWIWTKSPRAATSGAPTCASRVTRLDAAS